MHFVLNIPQADSIAFSYYNLVGGAVDLLPVSCSCIASLGWRMYHNRVCLLLLHTHMLYSVHSSQCRATTVLCWLHCSFLMILLSLTLIHVLVFDPLLAFCIQSVLIRVAHCQSVRSWRACVTAHSSSCKQQNVSCART